MAGDDPDYIAHLRKRACAVQPCNSFGVTGHHSTNGETEQHSKSLGGRRGKGQRVSDRDAFSLCIRHHAEFHDARGHFRDWSKAERRLWQDEQVRRYREAYEAEQDARPGAAVPLPARSALVPPIANDPKAIAQQFCKELELGDEVALRLERLLRSFERRVVG